MATTSNGENHDAPSLRVLGAFFLLLGGIVLIATFWALEQPRAALVNAVSGAVLAMVGGAMCMIAKRMSTNKTQESSDD
jgi:uncharacterized membrane-anchored protein